VTCSEQLGKGKKESSITKGIRRKGLNGRLNPDLSSREENNLKINASQGGKTKGEKEGITRKRAGCSDEDKGRSSGREVYLTKKILGFTAQVGMQ